MAYNFAAANRSAQAKSLTMAAIGSASMVDPNGFSARFARSVSLASIRRHLKEAREARLNAYRYGFRLPS